jgi:hypothetical protein
MLSPHPQTTHSPGGANLTSSHLGHLYGTTAGADVPAGPAAVKWGELHFGHGASYSDSFTHWTQAHHSPMTQPILLHCSPVKTGQLVGFSFVAVILNS